LNLNLTSTFESFNTRRREKKGDQAVSPERPDFFFLLLFLFIPFPLRVCSHSVLVVIVVHSLYNVFYLLYLFVFSKHFKTFMVKIGLELCRPYQPAMDAATTKDLHRNYPVDWVRQVAAVATAAMVLVALVRHVHLLHPVALFILILIVIRCFPAISMTISLSAKPVGPSFLVQNL
jgi:hypothetical protein